MSIMDLYTNNFQQVKEMYLYNPSDDKSYFQRAEVLDRMTYENRAILIETLKNFNTRMGCGETTKTNLNKLKDERTLAVVTGQQAGILTGPLYTIYKACTAILLAQEMTEKLGREVVPVFWVASEDHDFEEVNHTFIPSIKGNPHKISFSSKPPGKYSIGDIPLSFNVTELLQNLSYHTPNTKYKRTILDLVEKTAVESQNLAEWFSRIMIKLFHKYGLILIDPMEPQLRQLLKEGFKKALELHKEISLAVKNKGIHFSKLNLPEPIITYEGATNLFSYENKNRLPLMAVGNNQFCASKESELNFSLKQLQAKIEQEPTKFSPNVVLRPVFQDLLLPTLCYVGGPGEIGYYGQLKDVYPFFNLEMPIIFPRKRMILLEENISQLMSTHELTLEDILKGSEGYLNNRLEKNLPINLDVEINHFLEGLKNDYDSLMIKLSSISPEIKKLSTKNFHHIKYQVEYIKKKAWQKHRKNNKSFIDEIIKIENFLLPMKKPQERVYNILPFLNKYGFSIIDLLMTKSEIFDFDYQVLRLGDDS